MVPANAKHHVRKSRYEYQEKFLCATEGTMTPKQAIHILMLSPCYWLLKLPARKQLIRDYCTAFAAVQSCPVPLKKPRNP
jgi:hypothetical protein